MGGVGTKNTTECTGPNPSGVQLQLHRGDQLTTQWLAAVACFRTLPSSHSEHSEDPFEGWTHSASENR